MFQNVEKTDEQDVPVDVNEIELKEQNPTLESVSPTQRYVMKKYEIKSVYNIE